MLPQWWETQSDLATDDIESRREYIKALLAVSADDARYVMLVVAGSLAVVTLFVKDIPPERLQEQAAWLRGLMGAGLAFLLVAGGAFFTYAGAVNRVRMSIARCLASADAVTARNLWAGSRGVWGTNMWRYLVGTVFLLLGAISETVVLIVFLS